MKPERNKNATKQANRKERRANCKMHDNKRKRNARNRANKLPLYLRIKKEESKWCTSMLAAKNKRRQAGILQESMQLRMQETSKRK